MAMTIGISMRRRSSPSTFISAFILATIVNSIAQVQGFRFFIDREQCYQYDVPERGDNVHASFVVMKRDSVWFNRGIDLTVEAPFGNLVYNAKQQAEGTFNFTAPIQGLYKFCFGNNHSPIHATVDFDVYVGPKVELAKNEHLDPLMERITMLHDAIYSVRFEQHWLQAQTDRQAEVNQIMSKRVVYKAILESTALVGASLLQVYLLQRLFVEKLGKGGRV